MFPKVKQILSTERVLTVDYILWATFSSVAGFYMILPIFFKSALGFSATHAATSLTVFLTGSASGMLIYMRFFKYIQHQNYTFFSRVSLERGFLAGSGLLASILLFVLESDKVYIEINLILFFIGLFSSAFFPLHMNIMNQATLKKNKVRSAAIQRWAQNVGMCLFFALFAFWKTHQHYHIFYILGGVLLIASLAELFLCFKHPDPALPISQDTSKRTLSYKKPEIIFFILFACAMVIFMQIPALYAFYLDKYINIDHQAFAKLLIFNTILILLIQLPLSSYIMKHLSLARSFAIGLFLIGLSLVVPMVHTLTMVILSFTLWTVGEAFFFTATRAFLASFSSEDKKRNTKLSTTYYTIFDLSVLSCPIIIHFLYDRISADYLLVGLFSASILVALFGCWWLKVEGDN